MRIFLFCISFLGIIGSGHCQLVRKTDYDIAVALQLGGATSVILPGKEMKMALSPLAGMKMTIPFNRKWFLGCEINYTELKSDSRYTVAGRIGGEGQTPGETEVRFRMKQIQFPLYLKYMLNCNKASVLFGCYGSYNIRNQSGALFHSQNLSCSDEMEKWNAGIALGYEHRLVKHLTLMCQVKGGLKEVMHSEYTGGKKVFPVQACITLSYDIFRVGDCGCD